MSKQIQLSESQYKEVRRLQVEDGLRDFEAVAKVLNVPDDSFICTAVGTSSNPRDGLKVVFTK